MEQDTCLTYLQALNLLQEKKVVAVKRSFWSDLGAMYLVNKTPFVEGMEYAYSVTMEDVNANDWMVVQ